MKGQYRIINEILLFGITAAIVFSVAGIISMATTSMKTQAQREQYYLMSDMVSLTMLRAHLCGQDAECSIVADIPDRLSEDRYIIETDDGHLTITNFQTGGGITTPLIRFDKEPEGLVTSSAKYFIVDNLGGDMTLAR